MDTLSELLIQVAKNKDQQAFEIIYRQAFPRLMKLSLRYVNYDLEAAEEVLQESFIKIWARAEQYKVSEAKAISWMGTIVRNQAFDRLRTYKSRPQLNHEDSFESVEYTARNEDLEQIQSYSEKIIELKKILKNLPKIQQEVIEQSVVLGYTNTEISQRLQLPLGTVKTWIRRNMRLIKEHLTNPDCIKHGNCLES